MAIQLYRLKWAGHTRLMLSTLKNLQTEFDVDVTLVCGTGRVRAHSTVLSICCDFFRVLFIDHTCKHTLVQLRNVLHEDLKVLIKLMYFGEVCVPEHQLESVFATAETLKFTGLNDMHAMKSPNSRPYLLPTPPLPPSLPLTSSLSDLESLESLQEGENSLELPKKRKKSRNESKRYSNPNYDYAKETHCPKNQEAQVSSVSQSSVNNNVILNESGPSSSTQDKQSSRKKIKPSMKPSVGLIAVLTSSKTNTAEIKGTDDDTQEFFNTFQKLDVSKDQKPQSSFVDQSCAIAQDQSPVARSSDYQDNFRLTQDLLT